MPLEDLQTAAKHLIEGMQIRMDYMDRIGNSFPSTTQNFITENYPKNLPKYRRKNTEMCKCLSHLAPELSEGVIYTTEMSACVVASA